MIRNIRTGEMYGNRKEAKNRLGGLGAYNSAMRRGELLFINGSLALNHLNQKQSYEKDRNLLW